MLAGWTDGWMHRQMDGWIDGQTDGQMDGRTDGWMDGWMWTGRMDGDVARLTEGKGVDATLISRDGRTRISGKIICRIYRI
eukprot:354482-Chlamydomonas_euryale.AAC.4